MELKIFALDATRPFGLRLARALGVPLGQHEERDFDDGEHKVRSLENVCGHDVYVVQSLHGSGRCSVNDKLIRLLFFLGSLRDAGAARVTAVVPYLAYARKDRRTKLRDPVSTRYLAALFEAVGVDCVMTVDVHNLAAYENAFRIPTMHLESRVLFVDDLISSGTTQVRCAEACRRNGAVAVHGVAAHGAFVGDAGEKLGGAALDRLLITDTIEPPQRQGGLANRLEVVEAAPLCAEAVRRLHEGTAVEELLRDAS